MRIVSCPTLLVLTLAACGGETQNAPPPVPPPADTTPLPPLPPPVAVAEPDAGLIASADAGATSPAAPSLTAKGIALPGASSPASFDYIAADRVRGRIWAPIGNTGSVDVLDVSTGTITRVDGFKTAEREWHGKTRTMGPSAATVGDGFVYVGNRATNEVCAVDAKTLKVGTCAKVPSPTDGVAYVASTKEVWVTTPHDKSLTILDAAHGLKVKGVVKTDGDTEGYAIDEARGLFFTNLEDKGSTLEIDVKTRKVKATWNAGCSSEGPRGVAVDSARGLVFVACTDHVQVLDEAHDGAKLGTLDTGAGVDNLDYIEAKGLLVAAAGRAARVTLAHVDDKGNLSIVAVGNTAAGARNAVADADGNAYVVDPQGAQLLVLKP
jgi:DNA-binding beta-propeller fold protein YncE